MLLFSVRCLCVSLCPSFSPSPSFPPITFFLSPPLSSSPPSLPLSSRSPNIPTISGSESCSGQSSGSEPWIILYQPSTISLFKKKLKNHHGDLSPLVGN